MYSWGEDSAKVTGRCAGAALCCFGAAISGLSPRRGYALWLGGLSSATLVELQQSLPPSFYRHFELRGHRPLEGLGVSRGQGNCCSRCCGRRGGWRDGLQRGAPRAARAASCTFTGVFTASVRATKSPPPDGLSFSSRCGGRDVAAAAAQAATAAPHRPPPCPWRPSCGVASSAFASLAPNQLRTTARGGCADKRRRIRVWKPTRGSAL